MKQAKHLSLTPHFTLGEFQQSATASRLGIDNTIPEALVPNITNLCEQVLEPLRTHFGSPVIVSSGYRCPELNTAVGGVSNSQHLCGEAADIQPPSSSPQGVLYTPEARRYILRLWAEWIMDNCQFDQLIIERSSKAMWLHVSCRLAKNLNRQQVIT